MTHWSGKQDLARAAALKAFRVRVRAGKSLTEPVCIFDLAESMGVEVRFLDVPSLEGMYSATKCPTIVISSLRPAGRCVFTCAHELGHHVFNHGTSVDQLCQPSNSETKQSDKEYIADRFASHLLMPELAIKSELRKRALDVNTSTSLGLYAVACSLGVSYSALISHLRYTLRSIGQNRAVELLKVTPKRIREELGFYECSGQLVLVDAYWSGRPVDLRVGDAATLPIGVDFDGRCAEERKDNNQRLAVAVKPGIGRLVSVKSGWSCFVRVGRAEYVGRARYRHLEDEQ